jgi:uncharacterized RDD family membrane protein YckC
MAVTNAIGRVAFYPARKAARAARGPLESATDDFLSSPELVRIVDRALAGSLPEELTRAFVRHRVLERVVGELAAAGELERLVDEALGSPGTLELTERVLASDEMRRTLESVAASPALRAALASQSAGLAQQVASGVQDAAARFDQRTSRPAQRTPERAAYAGVGSRAIALALDALAVAVILAVGGALVAAVASLAGGIRPHWVGGIVVGFGWAIVTCAYFTLCWSTVGQTPGMRLLGLRVERRKAGRELSLGRSLVRTIGLLLAIIPCFAGFLPCLFDARRRGLPDYLAGTVVVYDRVGAA